MCCILPFPYYPSTVMPSASADWCCLADARIKIAWTSVYIFSKSPEVQGKLCGATPWFFSECPVDTEIFRYEPALHSLAHFPLFHSFSKQTGDFGRDLQSFSWFCSYGITTQTPFQATFIAYIVTAWRVIPPQYETPLKWTCRLKYTLAPESST